MLRSISYCCWRPRPRLRLSAPRLHLDHAVHSSRDPQSEQGALLTLIFQVDGGLEKRGASSDLCEAPGNERHSLALLAPLCHHQRHGWQGWWKPDWEEGLWARELAWHEGQDGPARQLCPCAGQPTLHPLTLHVG
jgi:hypothetical protein